MHRTLTLFAALLLTASPALALECPVQEELINVHVFDGLLEEKVDLMPDQSHADYSEWDVGYIFAGHRKLSVVCDYATHSVTVTTDRPARRCYYRTPTAVGTARFYCK